MQDINGHGVLVRQNDQVYCRRCGKTWDVTDPDPPKCKTGDDWRMLTPIECERLQTISDNYTNHVSNTQRYKMLGNGWTVDVIAHIFKEIIKQ